MPVQGGDAGRGGGRASAPVKPAACGSREAPRFFSPFPSENGPKMFCFFRVCARVCVWRFFRIHRRVLLCPRLKRIFIDLLAAIMPFPMIPS